EAQAVARIGQDLHGPQAQGLEGQQRAEVRGRLDGDEIAAAGHGPERKMQRLGRAAGDENGVRRQCAAPVDGASRDLAAQLEPSGRKGVTVGLGGRAPHMQRRKGGELARGQQARRGTGGPERDERRILGAFEHAHRESAEADADGSAPRGGGEWFGDGAHRGRPDEDPGLRPRFDVAAALEQGVRLQAGRQAHPFPAAGPAQRRQQSAGPERPAFDERAEAAGDRRVAGQLYSYQIPNSVTVLYASAQSTIRLITLEVRMRLWSVLIVLVAGFALRQAKASSDEDPAAIRQAILDYAEGYYGHAPERMERAVSPLLNKRRLNLRTRAAIPHTDDG